MVTAFRLTNFAGVMVFCLAVSLTRADQVVMQNGDRYNGKVLSLSTTNVVLQSEVLGILTLARSQVANVALASSASPVTNSLPRVATARTNAANDLSVAVRQLSAQTNLVRQVQAQFLATASPEASAKFNQLLGDLSTGKMSVGDLRAEAKSAAAQLRALGKEAGDDSSEMVNMYLSVLDGFLAETESGSATVPATNQTVRPRP